LDDVERRPEQRAPAEREDHGVGVKGAEPPKAQQGCIEVEFRPRELRRDDHTDQHSDDTPDDRHDTELAHHPVVVVLRDGIVRTHR
jgi:hypothetical protein